MKLIYLLSKINNNNITDFKEFEKLAGLLSLNALYVEKNPFCFNTNTYAAKLKHMFPKLIQIDGDILTDF